MVTKHFSSPGPLTRHGQANHTGLQQLPRILRPVPKRTKPQTLSQEDPPPLVAPFPALHPSSVPDSRAPPDLPACRGPSRPTGLQTLALWAAAARWRTAWPADRVLRPVKAPSSPSSAQSHVHLLSELPEEQGPSLHPAGGQRLAPGSLLPGLAIQVTSTGSSGVWHGGWAAASTGMQVSWDPLGSYGHQMDTVLRTHEREPLNGPCSVGSGIILPQTSSVRYLQYSGTERSWQES